SPETAVSDSLLPKQLNSLASDSNFDWLKQITRPIKVTLITCANNNSHCEMVGPGEAECVCNKGYHGYKCLRQGTFPDVGYSIVLSACTVVLSALLWFTQRRKVTHHTH
ncbi:ARAID-like protein, partial [Mya arenaria]